jgi:uncharacterized RDD family membrane protein YckC
MHDRCGRAGGEGDCTLCGAVGRFTPPLPETPVTQIVQDVPPELQGVREVPAGVLMRAMALVIDGIVLCPLSALAYYAVFEVKSLPLVGLVGLLGLIYKPWMESRYAATLGKFAVGVRVVDRNGERIGVVAAILRFTPWLIQFALGFASYVWLFSTPDFADVSSMSELAPLMRQDPYRPFYTLFGLLCFFDIAAAVGTARKRALHDLLADTYCVQLVPKQ